MTTNDVAHSGAAGGVNADDVVSFIMHHLGDSDHLRLPFSTIPLPNVVSRHALMLLLTSLLLLAIVLVARRQRSEVPTRLANFLELFVVFIRDRIAIATLGPEDGRRMTPFFCTLFCFILTANLIGLVPCFYTATANLGVTAALALVTLSFMIGAAICRHGVWGFFRNLAPPGVPWSIMIVIYPIEIASLFIRAFALTVRLFANELSGHMVLMFMVGLVVIFGYVALPAIILACLVFILEVFVAFLQAFIFTLFSAVFIGQTLQPEH